MPSDGPLTRVHHSCPVVCSFADDDPLPSFEKRQALAQQLGMTPRSVQIWFQNRRQRLLKPSMRLGEGEGASGDLDGDIDDGAATGSVIGADALAGLSQHGGNPNNPWSGSGRTAATAGVGTATSPKLAGNNGSSAYHAPPNPPSPQRQPQLLSPALTAAAAASQDMPPGAPPGLAALTLPPSLDPSAAANCQPDASSAQRPAHPYPVTAAHLVHAFAPLLRGEQQTQDPGGGISGHPSLPLLVSSLGSLMMGTASAGADSGLHDPRTGLPNALAMLPQAVAAGHVSPGAAALLMQALQQRMGNMPSGPANPQPSSGQFEPVSSMQATQPVPMAAVPPAVPPPTSSPEARAACVLPCHLGGPVEPHFAPPHAYPGAQQWPPVAIPSQQTTAAPDAMAAPHHMSYPASHQTATHPAAAAPTAQQAPAAGLSSGVDGLLLLSACADVQRLEDPEELRPPEPRQAEPSQLAAPLLPPPPLPPPPPPAAPPTTTTADERQPPVPPHLVVGPDNPLKRAFSEDTQVGSISSLSAGSTGSLSMAGNLASIWPSQYDDQSPRTTAEVMSVTSRASKSEPRTDSESRGDDVTLAAAAAGDAQQLSSQISV